MRATSRTQHPQHTKNEVTKPCAFQELNLQWPQHRACSSLGWEPPARSERGRLSSQGGTGALSLLSRPAGGHGEAGHWPECCCSCFWPGRWPGRSGSLAWKLEQRLCEVRGLSEDFLPCPVPCADISVQPSVFLRRQVPPSLGKGIITSVDFHI